jgi:hypothetical protein
MTSPRAAIRAGTSIATPHGQPHHQGNRGNVIIQDVTPFFPQESCIKDRHSGGNRNPEIHYWMPVCTGMTALEY